MHCALRPPSPSGARAGHAGEWSILSMLRIDSAIGQVAGTLSQVTEVHWACFVHGAAVSESVVLQCE
eukprot:12008869-Alexandrium_andersonii.AAC.1